MTERWGDSRRDRDALDRWITRPDDAEFYKAYVNFHLEHGTETGDNMPFQHNRIVYVGTFPDGSQLMVTRWVDEDGVDVSVEAATRPVAHQSVVWGPPIELTEPA